jgi:hypothetical protein
MTVQRLFVVKLTAAAHEWSRLNRRHKGRIASPSTGRGGRAQKTREAGTEDASSLAGLRSHSSGAAGRHDPEGFWQREDFSLAESEFLTSG